MDRLEIKKIVDGANRSEIHRLTGISLSGVSRILSGNRTPRLSNIDAIARQLGMSIDDLYNYLVWLRSARTRGRRSRRRTAVTAA